MDSSLREGPPFDVMSKAQFERVSGIAQVHPLRAGEYLFLLGDTADHLYVVSRGRVEICFPLSLDGNVRDVTVETRERGKMFGWSALVKPYRFTLSARGAVPSEIVSFPRQALLEIFEEDAQVAYHFTRHLAEVIGRRLLRMQALWARELQRALGGSPMHVIGSLEERAPEA